MPAAKRYINTANTPEYKKLEQSWRNELNKRQSDIAQSWQYYDGDMQKALKPDARSKVDDNVIINLVELLIEKGASGLMGSDEVGTVEGVKFEVGGEDEEETPDGAQDGTIDPADDPELSLEEWWDANKKGILLHDAAINGGVCGHVFMKIVPQDGDKPTRLINLNPANCGVFWDEQDLDRVLWYRIEFDTTRQDVVRAVGPDGKDLPYWTIYNYERKAKDGFAGKIAEAAQQMGMDDGRPWKPSVSPGPPAELPWQHEWAPIVDWKNLPRPNNYYGKNDIGQNWRINDALNILLSYAMRTLKIFTQPRTIATGVEAAKIEATPVDQMWAVGNSDAKVFNLEMQSDLTALLNIVQALRRGFWDTVREVDSGTVQDKLGEMTNFDLRVLFRDSLAKLTTKRLTYGDGLRRICQYMLELGSFPADMEINVVWPDPLPSDPVAQASALEKDVVVGGVSQETYQERRGYDPVKEAKNNETARANKVHDQTVVNQGSNAGMIEMMGRLARTGQGPPGQQPALPAGSNGKGVPA